jgi:hypothetical protein
MDRNCLGSAWARAQRRRGALASFVDAHGPPASTAPFSLAKSEKWIVGEDVIDSKLKRNGIAEHLEAQFLADKVSEQYCVGTRLAGDGAASLRTFSPLRQTNMNLHSHVSDCMISLRLWRMAFVDYTNTTAGEPQSS